MTERVLGPTGSPRRRRTLLLPLIAVLSLALFFVAGAQAVHDDGLFELDKNATNDLNTTKIGVLQSNISSTDNPIVVCESTTPPAPSFTIQIEAEQMTVTARAAISGGAGGCSTKASYTVTRGSNNVAHQKADDVTQFQTVTKDGPDWNLVHQEVTADANDTGNDDKCVAIGLLECSYVNDGEGATIFDQGGSKDHELITSWRHKSGSVSDKSNILNAYAAKDVDPDDGHQMLYFGADRLAVDGSTDAGFWFFRNEVIVNADGTFTGTHTGSLTTPGDILILTTFTQGGATNTVRVFKWVGTGGNESGTVDGPAAAFGDCVPGSGGDNGCATVNNTSILVPWSHQSKGEPVGGWVPAGGLLEGGLDLTALGLDGCFSSFLAETRSSPSVPAILEDFVLGKFEACGSTLTTTPGNGTAGAGNAPLTDSNTNTLPDTSIGTGTVSVRDRASLSVTGTTTWSGTLQFFICGPTPVASTTLCDAGGVSAGAAAAVSNATTQPILSPAVTLTSVGRYCWRGVFTSSTTGVPNATDSSSGECFEVLPVTPSLTTQAVASPVNFGQPVQDNATLGATTSTASQPGNNGPAAGPTINANNGAPAGGTIQFTLLKSDCTTLATGTGTNPQSVNVSGNGTYGPVSFTPDAPGTYHWKAQYFPAAGDPNNLGSTHNASCNDSNEQVVVQRVPSSISTDQSVIPNDSATVSATAGGNVQGSVKFRLFSTLANCQAATPSDTVGVGGLVYKQTVDLPGTATSSTVSTTNTATSVDADATVAWLVEFTSSNQAHFGRSSICTERAAIDFTDDPGPGTQP